MHEFLIATGVVTLAEIGDKTQLLAFLLATRFKKPLPIILGILLATVLNHGLAGLLGVGISELLGPELLRWILMIGFVAMGLWILIPDKIDEDEGDGIAKGWGVLGTTTLTFFLAEMGDKTQIATVALAAQFDSLIWVIGGTTLGMMIADVPAVFLGNSFANRLPLQWIRALACALFIGLGLAGFFYMGSA